MFFYSINNLRLMEVIDINTGSKLGYIKDLSIDCENRRVRSLIIPKQKVSWFSKNNDIEIPWKSIVKVGQDVILVKGENPILEDKE